MPWQIVLESAVAVNSYHSDDKPDSAAHNTGPADDLRYETNCSEPC